MSRCVRLKIVAVVLFALVRGVGPSIAADVVLDGSRLVDSAGREIHVAAPFQRIISLYGAHTENLFAMGAAGQIIGVTRNEDWPAQAGSKPAFSYHDDLEKFLAARPDLVLIRPMIDRGYGRLVQRLEDRGVVVISLQPRSVEGMFVYWSVLGVLSGHQTGAQQMVTRFKQTVDRICRRTSAIENKKRVYFEAIHDRMRTFAPTAMAIFALETAGGINVAGDAVPRRGTNIADYGKERILSRADEIDLYLAQFGPMNRPTLETINAEPGYGLIRAVRTGQVHMIDEKLVSRPTLRMLDGICRITRLLYPRLMVGEADVSVCPRLTVMEAGTSMNKEIKP
jgi:iron complex transport system substrate-binding protein